MRYLRFLLFLQLTLAGPSTVFADLSPGATCDRLGKEIRRIQAIRPVVEIEPKGSADLCFQRCEPQETSVESLLAITSPDEIAEVRSNLESYKDLVARVARVDLNGDGLVDVQISRRVGSASCVRNTYLVASEKGGLRLLRPSEDFDKLSDEAGNCGAGVVLPVRLDGRPYLIKAFYDELTTYRVTAGFNLKPVCTIEFKWYPETQADR